MCNMLANSMERYVEGVKKDCRTMRMGELKRPTSSEIERLEATLLALVNK